MALINFCRMIYIYRLIFLFLVLFSSSSFASIAPQSRPTYGGFTSCDAAYASEVAYWSAAGYATGTIVKFDSYANRNICYHWVNESWKIRLGIGEDITKFCTPNSTISSSQSECVCDSGFVEKDNSTCEPSSPPDSKCGSLADMPLGLNDYGASFGNKSIDWAKNQVGKSANSCFAGGCQVTGDVTGCMSGGTASTYCKMSNPKFTGESCIESDTSGDKDKCQDGYSASKHVPGVCVPDADKPDPSKDNNGDGKPDDADGLCPDKTDPTKRVPCEGKKSNCSVGLCESKFAPDLCIPCDTNVDKSTGAGTKTSTTCNGSSCTTTKEDGTKEEKPKEQFCAENPKSPLCIVNKWGGGSCASGNFSCDGDAIMCAVAREQHLNNCKISKLFESDNDSASLFNKAAAGTDEFSPDKMKSQAQQITVSSFDQSGFGWSHSCPADPSFNLPFANAEFSIPFSKICPLLAILSNAGVGITLLGSLVWVLGGRNNRG